MEVSLGWGGGGIPFLHLPAIWNLDVMAGAQVDILDNEMEATYQGRQHKRRQRLAPTIIEYRQTLFYCALLYCIFQILSFFCFLFFFTN